MSTSTNAVIRNQLLSRLSIDCLNALRPSLEPITLDLRQTIAEAHVPCEWVVFPDSGLVSIVAKTSSGRELEVGVFGRDGMGSTAPLLGGSQSAHRVYVQIAGSGHRLHVDVLRRAMADDAEFSDLMLRYVQAYVVQVSQTALANACYTIEQRLARWVLMMHDRGDGDDLRVTHEFLSIMLGVRRTGVTLAIHVLEGLHMIRSRRAVLKVLDRPQLESTAASGYGLAEAEYGRLIGWPRVLAGFGQAA